MKGLVLHNKKVSLRSDLQIPTPKKGEVLVKVQYASINSYDLETIQSQSQLLKKLGGLVTYPVMTGIEFSGIVVSDGKRFKKNDEVFGYPHLMKGQKTHQEYMVINENYISRKPKNLNLESAAALPLGSLTTLIGLEEIGQIKRDSRVLINGAAGGLGVYAVQIAKILGAHITAVVGPGQDEFIKSLGANVAINYKEKKVSDLDGNYDIFFDLTTKLGFADVRDKLSSNGTFIPANPFSNFSSLMTNAFRKKKVGYLMVDKGDYEQLNRITEWVEADKLKAIIDRTYDFKDYQEGFIRTREPGRRGRIVMKIEE